MQDVLSEDVLVGDVLSDGIFDEEEDTEHGDVNPYTGREYKQRMCQPRAYKVAFIQREYLRLILQPPKRRASNNPVIIFLQALRLVTKLHFLVDEQGMNLTYALLNTIVKYPVASTEIDIHDKT